MASPALRKPTIPAASPQKAAIQDKNLSLDSDMCHAASFPCASVFGLRARFCCSDLLWYIWL